MEFTNHYNIPVVGSFLRLFRTTLDEKTRSKQKQISFLPFPDNENSYRDIIVRYRDSIYVSETEIGKLGLSQPEIYAAIAHEIGHIMYGMLPFGSDAEIRADSFASELGLGNQMISVIEKIIQSRRYPDLISLLVQRIHFLMLLEKSA